MGYKPFFDKMIIDTQAQAVDKKTVKRQLEVGTWGDEVLVRIGQANTENEPEDRYAVSLSEQDIQDLAKAFESLTKYR